MTTVCDITCHFTLSERDAGNGFHVIRYSTKIDYEFVRSGIPYKYVVYSPRVTDLYEYLHNAPGESQAIKRLLKVPLEHIKLNGISTPYLEALSCYF